ncbi:MAG: hypothetical protein AAF513_20200 [Pseudomonadota bacterium]
MIFILILAPTAWAQPPIYLSQGAFGEPLFTDSHSERAQAIEVHPTPATPGGAAAAEALMSAQLALAEELSAARLERSDTSMVATSPADVELEPPRARRFLPTYPFVLPPASGLRPPPAAQVPEVVERRAFTPVFAPAEPAFRN